MTDPNHDSVMFVIWWAFDCCAQIAEQSKQFAVANRIRKASGLLRTEPNATGFSITLGEQPKEAAK